MVCFNYFRFFVQFHCKRIQFVVADYRRIGGFVMHSAHLLDMLLPGNDDRVSSLVTASCKDLSVHWY